jgi:two-component system, response regulator PdtaR
MAWLPSPKATEILGRRSPVRVLVVEDEALIAMHVEAVLEEEGFEIVGVAASCREATALAARESPEVAVVDLNLLDGATGLGLAEHLHATCHCGIVMATANLDAVRDAPFVQATLAKPYRDASLLAAVAVAAAQGVLIRASRSIVAAGSLDVRVETARAADPGIG